LVAVDRLEVGRVAGVVERRSPLACVVAARGLDLGDGRTEIRQQHRRERTREHTREIEYGEIGECVRHVTRSLDANTSPPGGSSLRPHPGARTVALYCAGIMSPRSAQVSRDGVPAPGATVYAPLNCVIWGTGKMGVECTRAALARGDLRPVAAIVTDPNKDGRDLGEICGLDRPLGAIASTDVEGVLT